MSNRQTCLLSLFVLCLRSIICKEFYMERGKPVSMNCGNTSSGNEQWTYNSKLIIKEVGKSGNQFKGDAHMVSRAKMIRGSLQISRLESTDSGPYVCEDGPRITEHKLYVFSVSVSPAGPFLQGTKVELRCQISGDSKVKPVWLRPNGTAVAASETISLTLMTADNGDWACQIQSHKTLLRVIVLGLLPGPILRARKGDSVLLPCDASLPLSSSRLQLQEGGWRRLDPDPAPLLSLGKMDGGLVWNSTGKQTNSLQFAKEKLDGNFSVVLKKVQQSGLYECLLKFKDKGNLMVQVMLEVNGLPIGTGATVNNGSDTDETQPDSEKGFLGFNLWVWLAVGLGSLILIALIAIIVYINRRNKRMKKRARKLRSMRQPLTARDYCQCNRSTAGRPNGRQREASVIKERQR